MPQSLPLSTEIEVAFLETAFWGMRCGFRVQVIIGLSLGVRVRVNACHFDGHG